MSQYLVHYRHATSPVPWGGQVTANSLIIALSKARDNCGLNWPPDAAPTFHEHRSLSGRLYRRQGINTQKLPGHQSPAMTEQYHDDRDKDWNQVFYGELSTQEQKKTQTDNAMDISMQRRSVWASLDGDVVSLINIKPCFS